MVYLKDNTHTKPTVVIYKEQLMLWKSNQFSRTKGKLGIASQNSETSPW